MRVLMISKACVVGTYQSKLEAIAAQPNIELIVAVPPEWRDERGSLKLERVSTQGYELVVEPIRFNGNFHLHYYPKIDQLITRIKPDLIHIDEEPYNLATWHALRSARRLHAKTLFFSWQNLNRRYPFPFSAFESYVLRHTDYAICGNQAAQQVWQAKGFTKPIAVIPQFGIDPDLFSPLPMGEGRTERGVRAAGVRDEPFTICYAGRFVPEKGVDLLIKACARLDGDYRLVLLGSGPRREALIQLATESGLGDRLTVCPWLPSTEFPNFLHTIDTLVLPSISKPNWIEQFGRVLVEAMACGVPVVGSTCGEIPNVIGEAGLIIPEGNVEALTGALQKLKNNPDLRNELQRKGRERVLERFTQRRIAEETVKVYREIMSN